MQEPILEFGMYGKTRVLVLFGVSGVGKTTIGRLLAERLGWDFADADDHHPARNVAKMAAGRPLDDADREPWLRTVAALVRDRLAGARGLVLACSALRASYRERIGGGDPRVRFVHLRGSFELIEGRIRSRQGHFMPAELLRSQFDTLEEPGTRNSGVAAREDTLPAPEPDTLTVDVDAPPAAVVDRLLEQLSS